MLRRFRRPLALLLAVLLLAVVAPLGGNIRAAGSEPVPGDVDLSGAVDASDARLALRTAVGLETLTGEKTVNADADRDGKITAADARLILRKAVGLETLEPIKAADVKATRLLGDDMTPYLSDQFDLVFLCSLTVGDRDHMILDNYFTVNVPTNEGTTEADLTNLVGVIYNENNEPFVILPDATARAEGKFRFQTLHFSGVGVGEMTDAQLLDTWAARAAAQGVTRRISEEELVPGLADIIADGLNVSGLGKDQYAGAIVRSILSLDTRGEILTAAVDGNMEDLQNKLVNYAGEYFLGKIFRGEEDEFLTKSLGDNMAAVKKSVKDGKFGAAAKEIANNILCNVFPMYNYADKIAKLTDKLADIWTDDMMNEQYEKYKTFMQESGRVTDEDWAGIYVFLRGASYRSSSKGETEAMVREKFAQRFKNEENIKKKQAELLRLAARWRSRNLMDTGYWPKIDGKYPSDTERLNSLLRITENLRSMLTVNGRFQRGKGFDTDELFLHEAVVQWVTNGTGGRDNFYKWLRDCGVFLPKGNEDPEGDPNNPFSPGVVIDENELKEGVDEELPPVVVAP